MKKILIYLLSFTILIGGLALYDFIRAQQVEIEVVSITPPKVVADPNVPVQIKLRVMKFGKPLGKDNITGLVVGEGNLKADQIKTDRDGFVTFTYFPYQYIEGIYKEMKVPITFNDISQSVFIEISKPKNVVLDVKKPSSADSGGDSNTMDQILGN